MPRYFFNIRDGYDVDEDEEGIELPDLEAARAEMESAAPRRQSFEAAERTVPALLSASCGVG